MSRAPGPDRPPVWPPDRPPVWPLWKITLVLYPFAAGAAAVNVFFLGLIGQSVGFTALSPRVSWLVGLGLGLPLGWIAARWVRRMIRDAQE